VTRRAISEHLLSVVFLAAESAHGLAEGFGAGQAERRNSRASLGDFFSPNGRKLASLSRALWARDAVTMAGVATMPSSAALPFCESCKQEVEAETNESNGFTCVPTRVPLAPPRDS
jgi:hypothetical protein